MFLTVLIFSIYFLHKNEVFNIKQYLHYYTENRRNLITVQLAKLNYVNVLKRM